MTIKRFYQILFLLTIGLCMATAGYVLSLIEESPTMGFIAFIFALIIFRALFNYTYKKI